MNDRVPESDPRWQLTLEVVNSTAFERSPRLRAFLLFICEMELTGRRLEINEQQIGVKVFGRTEGYNPGDDSIVRSQARLLRQRLEEHFRTAGQNSPLRIEIPKGSYVPFFEANSRSAAEAREIEVPDVPSVPAHTFGWRWWASGVVVLLLLAGGTLFLLKSHREDTERTLASMFWRRLFGPTRPTVIVPADSTLILIEELTGKPQTLAYYLNHGNLHSLELPPGLTTLRAVDLQDSHYTSMADLNLVSRLMTVPEVAAIRPQIRYARDLSMSDSKEDNLVLIGGARANPWVELFAPGMNFLVDYNWSTRENVVVNKSPRQGEQSTYAEVADGPQAVAFGLIAFQASLDRQGDALLVSGTTSAGTQLAADFLLNGKALEAFLRKIVRPDGTLPHFELLLTGRNVGGSVPTSQILAYRSGD